MSEIMQEPTQEDIDNVFGGFEELLSDSGQLERKVATIDSQIASLQHRLEFASESYESPAITAEIHELKTLKQKLMNEEEK